MKKKRKTSRTLGTEVAGLRDSLGLSQGELAQKLGVGRSAVSACEIGRIVLAPPALVRLAKLSPSEEQKLFFLEQAGLDRETIVRAADAIFQKRMKPPSVGETVRIPRFLEGRLARESTGKDVLLPAEFIPNPSSTICIDVDERSVHVHSPKGMFIVDTSAEGAQDLSGLWGHVVIIRHLPVAYPRSLVRGLCAGRLLMAADSGYPGPEDIHVDGYLDLLTGRGMGYLQVCEPYVEAVAMRGVDRADSKAVRQRLSEVEERARGLLRMHDGTAILGRVIGRLTGHLSADLRVGDA